MVSLFEKILANRRFSFFLSHYFDSSSFYPSKELSSKTGEERNLTSLIPSLRLSLRGDTLLFFSSSYSIDLTPHITLALEGVGELLLPERERKQKVSLS